MDIAKHNASLEQQWKIEHNKVMAQEEALDDLLVDDSMDLRVGNFVENGTLLQTVEDKLSQCFSV